MYTKISGGTELSIPGLNVDLLYRATYRVEAPINVIRLAPSLDGVSMWANVGSDYTYVDIEGTDEADVERKIEIIVDSIVCTCHSDCFCSSGWNDPHSDLGNICQLQQHKVHSHICQG